nr:phosphatidate cytidylyltransferase [Amylibacter sp.]
MSRAADFSDLRTRIISAVALVFIGLSLVWVGGDAFGVLLIIASGLMGWETSRMHASAPLINYVFGLVLAALVLSVMFLPMTWSLVLAVIALGAVFLGHKRPLVVLLAALAIGAGCVTLEILRANYGLGWTLWLLVVVVASDVGGYFAGKMIGGPKILPRISPKKTWSGTLGGWALAALVGYGAVLSGMGGMGIVGLSVLVAIAAQIGDLLESAMKRRAGIKDSSNLIPGHGGLWDRFDGTVGAACALGLVLALGGAGAVGLA